MATTESLSTAHSEREKRNGHHAEILLRKENASQKALKEKFVVVYEALFKGEDPSTGNPNFWNEVLLLKVNSNVLDRLIILTAEDALVNLKGNISMIFVECTKALTDSYPVRQQHALETLSVLMRSMFRKRFNNFGGEVTNILCGSMDKADLVFTDLLRSIQTILANAGDTIGTSGLSVAGVIQLLLVIVTAVDNINQNTLFEYFLKVDLFPTFTKIIEEGRLGLENSFNLLVLVVILANYQKNEANNSYHNHLKQLDQPNILKSISSILSEVLGQINKENIVSSPAQDTNAGLWNKLGTYVSSFVYKQPSEVNTASAFSAGPCLLVLYELIYLNPHFAKSLAPPRVPSSPSRISPRTSRAMSTTSTSTPTSTSPGDPAIASPKTAGGVALLQQFLAFCSYVFVDCTSVRAHTYSKLCLLILTCISEINALEEVFHDPTLTGAFTYSKLMGPADKAVLVNVQPQPGQGLACVVLDTLNLLMKQNIKKKFDLDLYKRSVGVVHRILSYEKKTATRLAYKWKDMWNTLFSVMKQSVGAPNEQGILGTSGALGGAVAVGPAEAAPSVVTGPAGGLSTPAGTGQGSGQGSGQGQGQAGGAGAVASGGGQNLSKQQLTICMHVVTVLNLFITYGDSFLPSPSDYDDLYYEIMRVSKMLEHFYTIAEKHEHAQAIPLPHAASTAAVDTATITDAGSFLADSHGSADAHGLATLSMLNIKTIITHFSGKIQQWTFAHPEVTLTPDMVLKIIKDNYDSLKLKLQENLDYFESYVETTETQFFRHLTRFIVQDLKTNQK